MWTFSVGEHASVHLEAAVIGKGSETKQSGITRIARQRPSLNAGRILRGLSLALLALPSRMLASYLRGTSDAHPWEAPHSQTSTPNTCAAVGPGV